ncbi:hypothetical protein OJF2_39370 [Aquisphaera giovannonii]|uniref:Transposase n=1 Tax=Aquisphaera giovannonii TaxID=406548 RepID=A0A5B9W5I9_9BACT|nr:hypothetical protein [Aquisphaera giovannonii]QEH35385.1 hypothetical protein OJF2_39370 [Aquisphaera giovannonii]
MARPRDPQLERTWSRRLERHGVSGLSIAEFCEREGLAPASFYYWRRRLAAGATPPAQAPPLFVPLRLDGPRGRDGAPAARPFEIELPAGVRLRLDAPPEPEWIGRLVAAVAGLEAGRGGP